MLFFTLFCLHFISLSSAFDFPVDVVFLLDASSSVGATNFDLQKSFISDIVLRWTVDPQHMQVGLVVYGGQVKNQFYLDQYKTTQAVSAAIAQAPYIQGHTHTADALRFVRQAEFSPSHGGRAGVPKVAVVITDGDHSNTSRTAQEAMKLRASGIKLYVVGVTDKVQQSFLDLLSNKPLSHYTVKAEEFAALSSLSDPLAMRIADEVPLSSTLLPQPASCLNSTDLAILVDSSSSLVDVDFHHLEDFLKELVLLSDIGPSSVQVSLTQFSNFPVLEFPLNKYSDRLSMLKALSNLQHLKGSSNIAYAIDFVREYVFTKADGMRDGVAHTILLITDGKANNPIAAGLAADNARKAGINIVVVGVGSSVDMQELWDIADDPNTDYTFRVGDFSHLKSALTVLFSSLCRIKNGTVISASAAPPMNCSNKLSNCDSYGSQACSASLTWAKENCRAFCGFCDPLVSPGFNNSCYYKGQQYKGGESWSDGCDYRCTCQDNQLGSYICYNICPVYRNLPSSCTLVGVPNKCCLQPVCNFKPSLKRLTFYKHKINSMGLDVCTYKGNEYFQSSSWQDGCSERCSCVNAQIGEYECQDICPQYVGLPTECHMEKKLGDCCAKPVCEFDSIPGAFKGSGTQTGYGQLLTQTPAGQCVDTSPRCSSYGADLCKPNGLLSWAKDNCKKTCQLCGKKSVIDPSNQLCFYNGKSYKQGESWDEGCADKCVCEDASKGYVRCDRICPTYINLPIGCQIMKSPNPDCCDTYKCDGGIYISSSKNPTSLANGGGIEIVDGAGHRVNVPPTLSPGKPNKPGTGFTGMQGPALDGCLVNGRVYTQGQRWAEGCDAVCVCQNQASATYTCYKRCPDYKYLPYQCRLDRDTKDSCCLSPKCSGSLSGYTGIPEANPGKNFSGPVTPPNYYNLIHHNVTGFQTFFISSGNLNTVSPVTVIGVGGIGYCERNGVRYLQGDSWTESCMVKCVCVDNTIGKYECVDQCKQYEIPTKYCNLVQDPANPCCQVPNCTFPYHVGQYTGLGHLSTTASTSTAAPIGHCIYKGVFYAKGQIWNDGCASTCVCYDTNKNLYDCWSRCADFEGVPDGCGEIADPKDPTCCTVPACTFDGFFTGHGVVPPTAPPGTYTGGGDVSNGCSFGGKTYGQGQSWVDGCRFNCSCEDASTGLWRCGNLCPRFPNLGPNCKLIQDLQNPCCTVPLCTQLVVPSLLPSGSPSTANASNIEYCVYKQAKYLKGRPFYDGCQLSCVCEDSTTNSVRCNNRCPIYNNYDPACTLKVDPDDSCCAVPVCGNTHVTSRSNTGYINPTSLPVVRPGGYVTGSISVTPAGYSGGCVFGNKIYKAGAKWENGCDHMCECLNNSPGTYRCEERCRKYTPLPSSCKLIADPNDACCQTPVCDLAKPVNPIQAPQLSNVCNYNNNNFHKGQSWYESCDVKCTCEDPVVNAIVCLDRCPRYSVPPPSGCVLQEDPNDPLCCKTIVCNSVSGSNGYTPRGPTGFVTGSYLVPRGGNKPNVCVYKGMSYKQGESWRDGCSLQCKCVDATDAFFQCIEMCASVPAVIKPGCYLVPDPDNDCCHRVYCDASLTSPKPKLGCVFNKDVYPEGSSWSVGCDEVCTCENATSGYMRCEERCKTFRKLPPNCQMDTDPDDSCCSIPSCHPDPNNPVTVAVPAISIGNGGGPDPNTAPGGCTYMGVNYGVGSTWLDGCSKMCTCVDDSIPFGRYECEDRCLRYPTLRPGCRLVTDVSDSCCPILECDLVTNSTRPNNVCTYKGAFYIQGQQWYDGCDKSCVCESAANNTIRCQDRCPYYNNVSPDCTMIPDPTDPSCCQLPWCPPDLTRPNPVNIKTIPAFVDGMGKGKSTGCVYNGQTYLNGQTWDVGCDLSCKCVDDSTGKYKCSKKCPVYPPLPVQCQLVNDTSKPCCNTAQCDPNIPTPTPAISVGNPVSSRTCKYKGGNFLINQTWVVNEDKVCSCEDPDSNTIVCKDRCPSFKSFPYFDCELQISTVDSFCLVPGCTQKSGQTYPWVIGVKGTKVGRELLKPSQLTKSGMCMSDGQVYTKGQQWTTVSGEVCVCVDPQSGQFVCQEPCDYYVQGKSFCTYNKKSNGCVVPTCRRN